MTCTATSSKFGLQPPWMTYANKVKALFEKDREVTVEWDNDEKKLSLYVNSQEKADALTQLMPTEVEFGNVKVNVAVIPANLLESNPMSLLETAFKGNPVVSYTRSVEALGFSAGYIVFKPEIVQFFNDDLSDINGNETTLYETIADEIFENHEGVFFCTDVANQALLGKPLGEWP